MFKSEVKKIIFVALAVFIFSPVLVLADYSNLHNMFIVSPTRTELSLDAGSSVIRNVYVTNRLGHDARFKIEIEDVAGSRDPNTVIQYYGDSVGPYSIKNYLMVDSSEIDLHDGETRAVPVMISVPGSVNPGGLYGGVFVSEIPARGTTTAKLTARLASLIFLRVRGMVTENGSVSAFNIVDGSHIFANQPINFQTVFENNGNIYLSPFGYIQILNAQGKPVTKLNIEPWPVFPNSLRMKPVLWANHPLFGRFTAKLVLNLGYTNQKIETKTYDFVIFPLWDVIFVLLGVAIVLSLVYVWLRLKKMNFI